MLKPKELFYILSDETRLRCLLLLQKRGKCCVCDFIYTLQTEQSKISRHLAILRRSGIVSHERSGAWVYYYINPNLPIWILNLLSSVTKETEELYLMDFIKFDERDRTLCKKSIHVQIGSQDG